MLRPNCIAVGLLLCGVAMDVRPLVATTHSSPLNRSVQVVCHGVWFVVLQKPAYEVENMTVDCMT